jgi:hypothetical protein
VPAALDRARERASTVPYARRVAKPKTFVCLVRYVQRIHRLPTKSRPLGRTTVEAFLPKGFVALPPTQSAALLFELSGNCFYEC